MIKPENHERRDWILLFFIIPIGIILIILVGQLAVRLVPFWSVNANMNSNLEPGPASARPSALLEPILPQILTPMAWAQTFLTPGADISFPPFLTFEPTATPSPTIATPTKTAYTLMQTGTTQPTAPTSLAATPTPSSLSGGGGGGGSGGSTGPTTCQDSTATNNGAPLPCTYPPPPPTCNDPAANNNGGSLPCVYPVISTIDVSIYGTPVTPIPSELGVGTLPDNTGLSDSNVANIANGTYVVVTLTVKVESTPDNNYDLVFFEYDYNKNGYILFDWIIVGITNDSNGATYYEVFNWGDNNPDKNSNVDYTNLPASGGCPTNDECDNRTIPVAGNTEIPPSENILYDPDYDPRNPPTTPETNGPAPQTGILIDVDKAASNPPAGEYQFVVFISPLGGGDPAQVDAVQTVEVPISALTP